MRCLLHKSIFASFFVGIYPFLIVYNKLIQFFLVLGIHKCSLLILIAFFNSSITDSHYLV